MKWLVILNKDGPNFFIENIVKEMITRGHEIIAFSMFSSDSSTWMFKDMGLEINDIQNLTNEIILSVDCIFCPIQSLSVVTFASKYIFSFCNMNPRFDEVRGSDFVFTLGNIDGNCVGGDQIKAFASMPVGLTKNDLPISVCPPQKRILFVDSGHFPFSQKGKTQIAEMILNICRSFPDYEVCIKPRWLRGTPTEAMTHVNQVHLYDVIENLCSNKLPSNLNMLDKYENLQELIDSSISVVTLCSTAYLDVAIRGKGLLIARGVENEDMYQVRSDYFNRIYDWAEGSGCVVDYRDICSYLPEGKACRPEHLAETFAYFNGAPKRTVDVMEFIWDKFISRGKYPKIKEYTYETYQEDMICDENLSISKIKGNRMFVNLSNIIAQCRSISYNINWMPFWENVYHKCKRSGKKKKDYELLKKKIRKIKYLYITENAELLKGNEVDRGYLYEAFFKLKQYDELFKYKTDEGFSNLSYNYFCGMSYYKQENYTEAEEYLAAYAEEANHRLYQKYLAERPSYKRNGNFALLDCRSHSTVYQKMYSELLYCINIEPNRELNDSERVIVKRVIPIILKKETIKISEKLILISLYRKLNKI